MRPRYAYQDRNYELRSLRSTFKVDTFWFPKCHGLGRGAKPISPGISNLQIHHLILLRLIDTWNPSFRPEASCNSSKVLLQGRRETGKWEEDGKKRRKEIAMKQLSPSLSLSTPECCSFTLYGTNNEQLPTDFMDPTKVVTTSERVGAIQQKRRSQTGMEKVSNG